MMDEEASRWMRRVDSKTEAIAESIRASFQ